LVIEAAKLSYIQWLFEQELTKQDNISAYRDYYDSDHPTQLTERQKEYLELHGENIRFCLNLCPVVVDSLVDRLAVVGFRVSLPAKFQEGEREATPPEGEEAGEEAETPEARWSAMLNEWWQDNRGDGLQRKLFKATERDGDGYLIVDWDVENNRPILSPQPAFTSVGDNPANGTGVKVHYGEDGRIQCASKRWKVDTIEEETGEIKTMRRMNLYFASRVEKYFTTEETLEAVWQEYTPENEEGEGEGWPSWWTDSRQEGGEPLGVPVVHLKANDVGYTYGESELKVVIPLQDILNKTLIDMVANADFSGFRVYVAIGGEAPGTKIFPGVVLHQPDAEARFEVVEGSPSSTFIEAMDAIIRYTAAVTRTPQYLFYPTGTVPSGEALRAAEAGLIMKVRERQVGFGNCLEDAMRIAIKLARTFGTGYDDIPDGLLIDCLWKEPTEQNETERLNRANFMFSNGFEREALRVLDYEDTAIEHLLREREKDKGSRMTETARWAAAARARFEQGGGPAIPPAFGQ